MADYADLHHDFTDDTAKATTADSGQDLAWSWTGANHISFHDGLMFNDGTEGQYYLDAEIAGPMTTVGVECVFFTGTASGMVYGSWSQRVTGTANGGWSTGLKSRAHVILYPDRLEYYVNSTGSAPAAVLIKTQILPTPLTQYADAAAWIAAGSPTVKAVTLLSGDLAVTIINGVALPVIQHPGINGTDRYPFWEAYKPTVGVKSLWAGTSPELTTLDAHQQIAQAASAAQLKADRAYDAAPSEVVRIEAGAMAARFGTPAYTALGAGGTPKWMLDSTTTEQVTMFGSAPKGWITYDIVMTGFNETAATGDVRAQVVVQVIGDEGQAIKGTTQVAPQTTFTAAASGIRQDVVLASNVSRITSGQVAITVSRNGADGLDTLTGDWALSRLELRKKS